MNLVRRTASFLLVAALLGSQGCELVVDFDRSRIPDATTADGGMDGDTPDMDGDLPDMDAAVTDAGADAGPDAMADATMDATTDGGGMDGSPDAATQDGAAAVEGGADGASAGG